LRFPVCSRSCRVTSRRCRRVESQRLRRPRPSAGASPWPACRSSPAFAIVFVALGATANLIAGVLSDQSKQALARLHPRCRRTRLHGTAAVDGPARCGRVDPGRPEERLALYCSVARFAICAAPCVGPFLAEAFAAAGQLGHRHPRLCVACCLFRRPSAPLSSSLPSSFVRGHDAVPLDARSLSRLLDRRRRDPGRASACCSSSTSSIVCRSTRTACSRRSASAISRPT